MLHGGFDAGFDAGFGILMALGLGEDLVDSVVSYLEANLPAKLAALDAEYADAIVLESTVATYKGLKSLEEIPNYPVLYALSPTEALQPRMISPTAADVESRPELSVGVVVLEQDSETLQKRLYRYARAITELLLDGWGNDSLNSWQFVTSEDWTIDMQSAAFARESASSFVGEVTLTVRGKRWEGNIPVATAYNPAVILTDDIGASGGFFYTSAGDPIAQFDVIQIDSELIVVAAVNTATNVITAGRGFGGTTAAAHGAATAILFRRHLT